MISSRRSHETQSIVLSKVAPAIGVAGALFLYLDERIWPVTNILGFTTSLTAVLLMLLAPVILRVTQSEVFTGNLLIVTCFVGLGISAYTTDGVLSPQVYLLIQLPIWVALFHSSRLAIVAMVCVIGTITLMYFREYAPPDLETLRQINTLVAAGGAVTVLLVVYIYDALSSELRRARDDALSANSAKTDFLTSMSHELRTPLNAITGFAQLARTSGTDNVAPSLEKIMAASNHLLALVDDLLDSASIRENGLQLSPSMVSVRSLFEELQPLFDYFCLSHHLEQDLSAEEDIVALIDKRALKQILLNLVSNAAKYSLPGSQIRYGFSIDRGSQEIQLFVSDEGDGIPEESAHVVFQPFERSPEAIQIAPGTGIGLYHCKKLVDMMGGEIWFESAVGMGTKFQVTIPIKQ